MTTRIFSIFLLLAGCSGDITPDQVTGPEISYCTDTRDGETFAFRKEGVKSYSRTWEDTCVDVVDTEGRNRSLCKTHEAWLKCGPLPK